MLTTRLTLIVTFIIGLLTGGLLLLARLMGALNPAGEFLAFAGQGDIFVYDPSTAFTFNLTRTPDRSETDPAWSSGGRMAYVADEIGQMGLYVQNLSGGRPVRLLLTFAPMSDPVWANDQRLAYVSGEDGNLELYLYDFDVGDTINLTRYPIDDFDPAWLPDGRLSFASGRSGNLDIFALDVATRQVENLTENAAPDILMRWSNAGLGAFVRTFTIDRQSAANPTPTTDMEVFVLAGDNEINVSSWRGFDSEPDWSSDGRLAFTSQRAGNNDIWVWNQGTLTPATSSPASDTEPRWSQAGQIAFQSQRQPAGLYLMDEPGAPARLVATDADDVMWWRWPR